MVETAGVKLWLKRESELSKLMSEYSTEQQDVFERHYIEICLAQGYRSLVAGGRLEPTQDPPHLFAYYNAAVAKGFHETLNATGKTKHAGRIRQALRQTYGFAALLTEYRLWTTGLELNCDVVPIDFNELGNFDFLWLQEEDALEIECKVLTQDYAATVNRSSFNRLGRVLESELRRLLLPGTSQILFLDLEEDLPRRDTDLAALANFIFEFVAGAPASPPNYVRALRKEDFAAGHADPSLAHSEARFITLLHGHYTLAFHNEQAGVVVAISGPPVSAERFSARLLRKLKEAADQLSGQRPGALFFETEGPSPDRPVNLAFQKRVEGVATQLFAQRPHLDLVILGFAGPPFSAGRTHAIPNRRRKRKNRSVLSLKLERFMNAPPIAASAVNLFRDFQTDWWRHKYRWEHKSQRDVAKAALDYRKRREPGSG
ncbi:MAG TPA: hypothetical protein VN811_10855 [Thermoanaerobaculia bacterium]|nr:hypothetical protein [Thermoanaerobaculia bacterium]